MSEDQHFRALERMYESAPCNRELEPRLRVHRGEAEIRLTVRQTMLHAAHAVHGAFFFKMLDDAAFFAANSLVDDVFVLTASLNVNFFRPVTGGELISRGRVVRAGRRILFAEAVLSDGDGREVARGSGVFARSEAALDSRLGYHRGEEGE